MVFFVLSFEDFVKRLSTENIKDLRRVHYSDDDKEYVIYFRGKDFVYKTVVNKQNIISFGESQNVNSDDSLREFENIYLSGATKIINYEENFSKKVFEKKNFDLNKIVTNQEMIDDSDDYTAFLSKTIKNWESNVLKAINDLDPDQFSKSSGTFGEFLSRLFNTVNSASFLKGITVQIKKIMKEGVSAAEEDLNIDIGFGEEFNRSLTLSVNEEMNGYRVQGDGVPWHGIKGATKQLQFDIIDSVTEGFNKGDSREEVIKRVKDLFTTASNAQAERIARTETTRLFNRSLSASYKDGGVKFKWVDAVNDSKTSDLCKRLGETYDRNNVVPIDEPYVDEVTGKSFLHPAHHVNCRCRIRAGFKKKTNNS